MAFTLKFLSLEIPQKFENNYDLKQQMLNFKK